MTVARSVRRFLELIRFSHTVFAFPFALMAALLIWGDAEHPFRWRDFAGLVLCMIFARSAAMAFNRIVDRQHDALNPRTAGRHLPAGLLSVTAVRLFTIACVAGFIGSTLLFLPNRWPLWLATPVILFLLGYSYAKRFTAYCHYWLAAALMLSPIATWIALTGTITAEPLWLAAVIFFWVGGFDILYACQDRDFDAHQGLNSIPAKLGIRTALRIAAISHAAAAVCLLAFWYAAGLGALFLAAVAGVMVLLGYEHQLVRPEDLSRVNIAFFRVNAIISLGLLLMLAADRLWPLPVF